ncbi:MAG: TonB-dependent receptor [Gemmatimonadetes bacterium]|nr:TonB-dependent receptor [Gemmatimonadota bacterium]
MRVSPLLRSATLLACAALAAPAAAQAPAGPPMAGRGAAVAPPVRGEAEVRGVVVDSTGSPVPSASVALRSRRDSALVAGAIADADGRFRLAALGPGAYTLRVTRVGFLPLKRDIEVTDAAQKLSLASIRLTPAVVSLQSVAVTGQQDAMIVAPDRNAYRAKDVAPQAANASEVLEAVPAIQVDGDGKVSLRGNENVVVQVNGRPTPLKGAQLASFLKTLPGPVVERIEVIPNPSAKYDPEGMAGIINIVLKQDADLGLSGGYNLSFMNQDRLNGSGNIGWQAGPWSLFGSYGYNRDQRSIIGSNVRRMYDASRTLTGIDDQDVDGPFANAGHNVTTNVDFRPSKQDVISNALVLNWRKFDDQQRMAVQDYDGSQALTAQAFRPRNTGYTGSTIDYTLAFKRTIEPRKNELSTELRVNRNTDIDDVLFRNMTWGGGTLLSAERQQGESHTTQVTAQLDWTKAFGASTKLETGMRGNARWINRDFRQTLDASGSGAWSPGALSNTFSFDDQVGAAYAVVSQTVGKFDVQGGLRAEYTNRDFTLGATAYPYQYWSFFPSMAASYKLTDELTARASYSRRIRRPGTWELNPFPQFMDAQNVQLGNPNLRPEFTDAYELSLTAQGKLGMIQLSPFYRHTTDIVRFILNSDTVVDARHVSAMSFSNLAVGNSWGADLNAQVNLGPQVTLLGGANVFKVVTDGGASSSVGVDAIGWRARLNATWRFTQTFTTQVNGFYNAPMNVEGGRFGSQGFLMIALRQKIQKDRGTISLRIQDPFNMIHMSAQTTNGSIIQLTDRTFGVRGVFLGYSWAMGQAPRFRPQQGDGAPGAAQPGMPATP